MDLRTWFVLTLGGLIASILLVSGAGSIATGDLAERIKTLDQASVLARHLDKIERARRRYQASGAIEDLGMARSLVAEAADEIATLKAMSGETGDQADLIQSLDDGFRRYQQLLDAYAGSERSEAEASAAMATQLNGLKVMAAKLKREKESDYHRSFAAAASTGEAEERLKTALRLTALANELIVLQMSIERSVALFKAGDKLGAADIPLEIGRIAEIADRIRRIEQVTASSWHDGAAGSLPDQLAARSNQFQAGFDDFRLATRDQTRRAEEMADVATEVTHLIQKINALQTEAAVRSSDWTLALSLLGVATALILGAWAAVVIRNRIIMPLMTITETMRQMSAGELTLAVPGHERRDELGAMARALEVFRRNSLEAQRLAKENLDVERRLAEEKAEAAILEQSLETEKELNAQQRRFVSLVSHEFRTPLAIIDGQAQRLVRRGDKMAADQRAGSLEKVRSAVIRLTGLMESVLSSASLEAGSIAFNPTPMDLRALIRKACENQEEISSQHKINVDINALPETYLGDPKLLHQVAANLLSNAVKYSPGADRVDVIGRSTDEGFDIAVRDYGVGVPKSDLPKLCQRFFRASTSTGIPGTGIGLNLVKALVEMHDGVMEVASIEGEGSTFTVKLPNTLPSTRSDAVAA
ncbi:MAG: ATP-binding protein [Geminicoccaceae bacterium]